MAVFEAEHMAGAQQPDGAEVLEVRFVTESEAAALPKARWVPEVLEAVFRPEDARRFSNGRKPRLRADAEGG
jgi:hypothetical protein